MLDQFVKDWTRFVFTLSPFFVLSVHLALTHGMPEAGRRRNSLAVSAVALLVCVILYYSGGALFACMGITVDSFRVGAGALLFLSAVDLVRGGGEGAWASDGDDITVVPMAIPVIVGPAVTGTLLVMGAEADASHGRLAGSAALLCSMLFLAAVLYFGSLIERVIRQKGVRILSKLSGMVLAAVSAQMVCVGVRHFIGAG